MINNRHLLGRADLAFCAWTIRPDSPEFYTRPDLVRILDFNKTTFSMLIQRYENRGWVESIREIDESFDTMQREAFQSTNFYRTTEVGKEFAFDVVTGFFLPKKQQTVYYNF